MWIFETHSLINYQTISYHSLNFQQVSYNIKPRLHIMIKHFSTTTSTSDVSHIYLQLWWREFALSFSVNLEILHFHRTKLYCLNIYTRWEKQHSVASLSLSTYCIHLALEVMTLVLMLITLSILNNQQWQKYS